MREIKFRQPLFIGEKFHSWHYWGFLSAGEFASPSNQWIGGKPLQQFTGLKDKNGKEIYEGDIVLKYFRFDFLSLPKKQALEVTFNNGKFCADNTPCLDLDGDIEVVGNIYENPELIKGA